jgi:MSHA biogenesis protein MshN
VSVINKMLRDLDQRQAASPSPAAAAAPLADAALQRGTAPVSPSFAAPKGESGSRRWLGVALLGAVAVLAAAGWYWQNPVVSIARVEAPRPITVSPATAPAPAAVAASAPAPSQSLASTVAAVSQPVALRMDSGLGLRNLPRMPSPPAAAPSVAPTPAVAASSRAPQLTATTAPSETVPTAQRQQQAGSDALAQAQSLWNSGSRDTAIDLMQQSVSAAERSVKAGTSQAGNAVLLSLVRELTRMQLAESRFGPVADLLSRLEPVLGNPADLWAIRANAAQRLGRHQESVHAYMMALQSRPDEQRWLLGSAVSLAALGQTASAAEMAEKARAVGDVSRDVLTYLRQMGVPLKDK